MDKVVLKKALKYAASKGKGKDTILAHLNPREVALLKEHGGSGTRNEHTGLYQFDSESGGEGPGAEGGGNGPGMGADGGGSDTSGGGGGNKSSTAADESAAAAASSPQGKSSTALGEEHAEDQSVSVSGKGIMDQLGIPQEIQNMIELAGKVPTGLIGVPNFAGIASTVNSMSKHGVDQPSNPGGNISSDNGGIGMGKGGATDPGSNGPGPAGSGGSMGGNINGMPYFGQAPSVQTTAQRDVAALSPQFGPPPGATGPQFGAPPNVQSPFGGFGGAPTPYRTPVLQPNIRRF